MLVRGRIPGGLSGDSLIQSVESGNRFWAQSSTEVDLPDQPDSEEPYDARFVKWMIKNKGLAAIPVSAFYSAPEKKNFSHLVRFCFAKEDATLKAAADILQKWRQPKTTP
ncbi:hypothetical protein JRQ81_008469 [Phrynocephalus forsythii]|uniref:cysteine-S-conjugate beta-lyase n=1 Tax=Phrynocephalus forsythii TaxID=171643 RepID=A0A9Q1ASG9_9SAUR|nr:hypothetical protein JRQ81_008469 [Phrynocephalus forsythii]